MNNQESGGFLQEAALDPTPTPEPAPEAAAEAPKFDFEAAMTAALSPEPDESEQPNQPAQTAQPNTAEAFAFLPQATLPEYGVAQPANPAWTQSQLDGQLAQISALDPTIRSFNDLATLPQSPMLEHLVATGCDVVTAFRAVRGTEIAQHQAQVARQQAINQLRSTQHMAPAGGGAQPGDGLTDAIIDQYRTFHPNWSRGKIAKYHAQFKKG